MEPQHEIATDRQPRNPGTTNGRGPRTSPRLLRHRGRALPVALLLTLAGGAAANDGLAGPVAVGGELPPALRRFAFVENLGQWGTPASHVAAFGATVVRVEEQGFVVDARPEGSAERVSLHFVLEGARDGAAPAGEEALPGVRNYFLGDDPAGWRTGVRSFSRVVYPGAYEGVDLVLREAGGMLEYDLHLASRADLASVVLRVDGVEGLEVDAEGGLLMRSAAGTLRQSPPVTWSVLPSGEEQPLECAFVVLDERRFGFALAEHDPALPVVIDPGLEWATYLGGVKDEPVLGMTRTATGDLVVTGLTRSPDFPRNVEHGSPDNGMGNAADAFVSILDPTGSTLLASAVIGGTFYDCGIHVQVNAAGEVFVVGDTFAVNFPVTPNAFQATLLGGPADGFVLRLSKDLGTLLYSSYLGGTNDEQASRLTVREPAIVTVAGVTASTDLTAITHATAVQPGHGGEWDLFVCRLDLDQPKGSQLLYGTYLGGSGREGIPPDNAANFNSIGLHEDDSGVITLTEHTKSDDVLVTPNCYDDSLDGDADVYLARLDPSVAGIGGLAYATYIGGGDKEAGRTLAVDSDGVVTLGGWTYSADFPTTTGAYAEDYVGPAGFNDAFLLRLDPSKFGDDQLVYGTFLPGAGHEQVRDLKLDAGGRIVASGHTGVDGLAVNTFPATCGAYQTDFAGDNDGFVVYLDPAGNGVSDLLYSTYVGTPQHDLLMSGLEIVSEDPSLKVVAAGRTNSPNFPTTSGAYQENHGGGNDGVVLQLEINPHTYCHAEGNSADPDGAIICGSGSVVIADNDLTLSASGLPSDRFGYFVMAPDTGFVPNVGGGQGNLCVGGAIVRFAKDVLKSDLGGQVSFQPDLTDLPQGTVVGPGETWYFQFWYRDKNPGVTHNLSNGLALTFH